MTTAITYNKKSNIPLQDTGFDVSLGCSNLKTMAKIDLSTLVGKRFNRLVIVSAFRKERRDINRVRNSIYCICKCDCGNITKEVLYDSLKATHNHTTSCGCAAKEYKLSGKAHLKHGYAKKGKKKPEHNSWIGIQTRCFNKDSQYYYNYGGRGIVVCSGWLGKNGFINFIKDMGDKPSPDLSLDRIDNNGNYSCGHCEQCMEMGWRANCRWATDMEQTQNQRKSIILEYNGQKMCISEWARVLGVDYRRIYKRVKLNWSVEDIMTIPKQKANSLKLRNVSR